MGERGREKGRGDGRGGGRSSRKAGRSMCCTGMVRKAALLYREGVEREGPGGEGGRRRRAKEVENGVEERAVYALVIFANH